MLRAQAIPLRALEAFPAKEAGHEIMKAFARWDYAGRQLGAKKISEGFATLFSIFLMR
jgi:hypothetical protein